MNFHLKLYHWAMEASYGLWQLNIYRLKSEYLYIVFYLYNYKKVKIKQKCWFLEKSSLNWVLFDAYQLYTVLKPLRSCQKLVSIKIDLDLRFEWCDLVVFLVKSVLGYCVLAWPHLWSCRPIGFLHQTVHAGLNMLRPLKNAVLIRILLPKTVGFYLITGSIQLQYNWV